MVRVGRSCALVLLLTITACAAPAVGQAPEPRTTVSAVYVGDPALLPMAVTLIAAESGAAPMALVPAQVVELTPGIHALATTLLPATGVLELDLPFSTELPDELRVAAPDALDGPLPAGCAVAASNATARVTPFEPMSVLGPSFVYGFTIVGPGLLALTPGPVNWADPGLSSFTLLGWVHADAPVSFASSGTCSDADVDLLVDLSLVRGWNRVGVRIDVLGGGRTARTIALDEGVIVLVSPFAP